MEFEHILAHAGDFGTFQRRLLWFFIVPAATMLPVFVLNNLFMLSAPDHWCYVPELENLTVEHRHLLTRPAEVRNGLQVASSCSMHAVNYTDYLTSDLNISTEGWPRKHCPNGWEYDYTWYDETATTKWDLVCDRDHLPNLVLTLTMVGSAVGTPIYGMMSDSIGRKPTFFICLLVVITSGLVSIVVPNFIAFAVLRMINGSLYPSVFQVPYIIILEVVRPDKRSLANAVCNIFWMVGMCILPLIAYLSRSWFNLGMVITALTVPFFGYWWWLPESPRWLISQQRYDEAAKILEDIARRNGRIIPAELKENLKLVGASERKPEKASALDFCRFFRLRNNMIFLTLLWTATVLTYYGLQLSTGNLYGNEFLNFFLLALVELPSYLAAWYIMDRAGRRWSSVGFIAVTVISCFIPPVIPAEYAYIDLAAAIMGKFGVSAAFMVMYQQAAELYPTPLRTIGLGITATVGTIVSIAMPYIVYLGVYNRIYPFIIMGLTCVIAGVGGAFLPETLGENLPQTVADAASFGADQKFFSWIRKSNARKPSSVAGDGTRKLSKELQTFIT